MKDKDIINFFFELGMLKRVRHEGWINIGIENLESVGEHSLRAAQIGFVLAKLENYVNPQEVCSMLVFHDIGECRIGDIHKIANRYVKADEEKAVKDQLKNLDETGKDIFSLWKQIEHKDTKAGKIAKDADYLEQAITAKEYMEKGFKYAENWIDNIKKVLRTEKARELLEKIRSSDSNEWWQDLKLINDYDNKKSL